MIPPLPTHVTLPHYRVTLVPNVPYHITRVMTNQERAASPLVARFKWTKLHLKENHYPLPMLKIRCRYHPQGQRYPAVHSVHWNELSARNSKIEICNWQYHSSYIPKFQANRNSHVYAKFTFPLTSHLAHPLIYTFLLHISFSQYFVRGWQNTTRWVSELEQIHVIKL